MENNNKPNQPNPPASSQPPVPTGAGSPPGGTPKPETPPPPASPPPGFPAPGQPLKAATATPAQSGVAAQIATGLPRRGKPVDKVCWRSEDGLVTVSQKVRTAGRYPPHGYPVVVLECVPKEGQRIRKLANGGLEILLNHFEVENYLAALSLADGKVRYEVVQRVPVKDPDRKAYWDGINSARHERKSRGQAGDAGLSR